MPPFLLTPLVRWAIFFSMKIMLLISIACLLGVTSCMMFHLSTKDETGVTMPCPKPDEMSDSDFVKECKIEMLRLRADMEGLRRLLVLLDSSDTYLQIKEERVFNKDQRELIDNTWAVFLDYMTDLDRIRLTHSSFWKLFYPKHPEANIASFSLTHMAYLALNIYGSHFIAKMDQYPSCARILDEPRRGIAAETYSRLKYRILNLVTYQWGITYSQNFEEWAKPFLSMSSNPAYQWIYQNQMIFSDSLMDLVRNRDLGRTGENAIDVAKAQVFSVVFPMQKSLAQFMGRTRYKPGEWPRLISESERDSLQKLLQPGDILLSRSNWMLSNIGLPGYWPHALLYTGSQDEWARYFDPDSQVKACLMQKSRGEDSLLAEYLFKHFPEKWALFASPESLTHRTNTILEALSEGIVPHSVQHAFNADYAAALRPNVSKSDKILAIIRAFEAMGRPYDFDFNFATDDEWVCTELVYKVYQPRAELEKGLDIPLENILGRLTLPPNSIVRLFDQERTMGQSQFAFVAFLDGDPKAGCAVFRDESSFRSSWQRMKWDFLRE